MLSILYEQRNVKCQNGSSKGVCTINGSGNYGFMLTAIEVSCAL